MGDPEHAHLSFTNPVHGALQFILEHYHEARQRDQRLDTTHPLWQTFRTLEQVLRGSDPVKARQPDLAVDWSLGKGNWARIPWIAFLDRRETTSTRQGVYGVLLFCEDMSGVYLTFNQGVTQFIQKDRRPQARAKLRTHAEELRQEKYVQALRAAGFLLDDHINLHTEASLGTDYEFGTIAYKLYPKDGVPLDRELQQDLEALLRAYDGYLKQRSTHQDKDPIPLQQGSVPIPDSQPQQPRAAPIAPVQTGSRVFVSHSHADIDFCRTFVNILRSHGLHVWYDEHNLGSGVLRETIERELAASEHFIIILSPTSLQSPWVKREYNAALDLEDEGRLRTFVPIMAEHCEIPLMLRGYKRIQARDGGADSPQEAAVAYLRILEALASVSDTPK